MAQTAGKMNGSDMAVYFASTEGSEVLVAHAQSCSFDFTHDARDVTTKDSGAWRELAEGLRSASVSTEHL